MKHLGDITKINGAEIEPVDVITGGSPCQDLSVAGRRAGLDGERSGLFMEQIRIVKEMRASEIQRGRRDEHIRPRFMVWENVPGAFSSNHGKDFQAVLTEIVRIVEPNAPDVPMPDKGGWSKSGCLYDPMGKWSIAWRVHDAQFWGVPQRRKRIALVADFGGMCAPEILFERKGLPRYSYAGGSAGQIAEDDRRTSDTCGGSAPSSTLGFDGYNQRVTGGVSKPLNNIATDSDHIPCVLESNQNHATISQDNISPTLPASMGLGGGYVPMITQKEECVAIEGNGARPSHQGDGYGGDVSYTLNSVERHSVAYRKGAHPMESVTIRGEFVTPTLISGQYKQCGTTQDGLAVFDARGKGGGDIAVTFNDTNCDSPTHFGLSVLQGVDVYNGKVTGQVADTITAACGGTGTSGCKVMCTPKSYGLDRASYNQGQNAQFDFSIENDKIGALTAKGPGAVSSSAEDYIVRRLTPLECERLQGYPDEWTNIGDWVDSKGKAHKGDADAPRYKALGNSIALPFWKYLARRICAVYERDITMGSLFDGIGGFPLVFERCGAKAVWASEIEEFCIAVTKERFGDD